MHVDRYLLPPLGCSAACVFTPLAPGRNCRGRALSLRAGQRRSDYPGPVRAAEHRAVAAVVACAQTPAGVDVPGLLRHADDYLLGTLYY